MIAGAADDALDDDTLQLLQQQLLDTRDDAGIPRSRVGFYLQERWAPIGTGTTDYYERRSA